MDTAASAIVFDVDGVLVETESSYGEAVVRTVRWLLAHEAELADDGPAIDRALARLWKREGSWNNDWDLAYGMYCWLAAAEGATTTERRRSAGRAEAAARAPLAELERRAGTRRRRSWDEVRGIFEEIYNGTDVAVTRYGVEPRVRQARGLKEDERVLLERALLEELAELGITEVGVVTGRSRADWEQIRPRLPLPLDVAVATDDDGRKPDPAPLRKVLGELRPRAFVAVGDTLDDVRMVQRWNETAEGERVPGTAVVLCPEEDEPAYRAAGATLFIRRLAELPALLRRASSPPGRP